MAGPIDDDSDVQITVVQPSVSKKRKLMPAGRKVEWSGDESEDDAYDRLLNSKKNKRKLDTEYRKRVTKKAKESHERKKKAKKEGKDGGESSKQKAWGEEEDYDDMGVEIPEYLKARRKEFDENYDALEVAGLRLPPSYENIEFSDDERLQALEERPSLPNADPSRPYKDIELPISAGVIPACIAQYLREYQVEGVAFLHELFVYQKGGLLGDDMGLGKTVQVAAFLSVAFGKTGDERDKKRMRKMRRSRDKPWYPRILIVCPASLTRNWRNELDCWGFWHVDLYHGSGKEAVLDAAISGRLEIVITTYTTYKNDKDKLNSIKWDCIVADECHQIKGKRSQVTQALNEVNALCRIGLTGTAIQNNYEEFWTLLNWTNPGKFGPALTWNQTICDPMRIGQSHDATHHQLKVGRGTAERLVKNLLPRFFLRRMKSLIAHELPKKTDKVVFCPLTETQRTAYEQFLDSEIVDVVKNSSAECECESGKKRSWCCHQTIGGKSWKELVFPVITTLQKLANHLALLIPNSNDLQEKQERDLIYLQELVPDRWKELYANRDSLLNLVNPDFCGKWNVLKKLLTMWHNNGDKVLIFSHSVRLLTMLQMLFNNTSYNVSFLSGQMPMDERQQTVDDFNSNPAQFVFLISTKAGGVGLNITSANKVVIFDPNWNPSYDLQAQDRAYRMGQRRDVEVYRLISAGTIEEIMYARQIYKQQQANIGYNASTERRYFKGVQNNSGQKGELFGLDNLLSFHGDDVVLKDIVNKTNIAEAKKGLSIMDFDMEDALHDDDNPLKIDKDDEDGAMEQLAALLTQGETAIKKLKPRTDPIQAILASAGVMYTHENSEVVGSSKVEAQLSRRALETGNDVQFAEERMFDESQHIHNEPGKIIYQFRPPEEVMMRQFCTMAKTFGFDSATEFALVVEGWTQKERTDCLERFYLKRKERLAELEAKEQEAEEPELPAPNKSLMIDDTDNDDDDEL